MLVIDDSPYAMRVPIQIGTLHIDMALDLATEEERQKLNHQWRRAELASSLRMKGANANVEDSEESKNVFDLDNVTGSVQITKDLSLLPFENVTISGLLKGPVKCSTYFKRVNVAIGCTVWQDSRKISIYNCKALQVMFICNIYFCFYFPNIQEKYSTEIFGIKFFCEIYPNIWQEYSK